MATLAFILRREHLAPRRGNAKPHILLAELAMSRGWMPGEHPKSPTHNRARWVRALIALSNDVELSVVWPGIFVGPNQVFEGSRLYVIMTQLISLGFAGINKRKRRPMIVHRPVPGQVALAAIHNQQVNLTQGLNTLFHRQTTLHTSQVQSNGNQRDLSTTQEQIRDDQRRMPEQQEANANVEDGRHKEHKAELNEINDKLARQKAN
ncbi:hypothetical protein FN846DRAFT_908731 [Sphaerosporella brunnea]|uniref:Uncharacterized protein n=1 Tax=Sphaerosporella brunnea TaxID=1250544 RepID=A0A5J5ES06_9PEZI|nr:hypothetical protein FN846DRAFT_908731 [Sphaerosporella brunnea]